MKVYPVNYSHKIGFERIKELIGERCYGDLGKGLVDGIKASKEIEEITDSINQVWEFRKIIEKADPFPGANYLDARPYFYKIDIDEAYLDEEEFFTLKSSLRTLFLCLNYLKTNKEDCPALFNQSAAVMLDQYLLQKIDTVIDDKAYVKDTASPELFRLRKSIEEEQRKAKKLIERIMSKSISDGYCPEDVNLTIRDGRLVIPVLAEHKRHVKGYIHDESSTGQTSFIEPTPVMELNNTIKDLEYQERREVIRLLKELTYYLRPYLHELEAGYDFLALVDLIRAKARLAIEFNCIKPKIENEPKVAWKEARHPLLEHSLSTQNKKIIPLDINLDHKDKVLVISGPNAGGKSVCLKTLALVQYMFQCGLLVPVREDSVFGIFESIFIDIGDEQSIENDLSTYSSHLQNMKFFMNNCNQKTMFLIDEFGTGTEPQFGGAIAESIIRKLHISNALGVITTHYANLKKTANDLEGLTNAAMRYDVDKMEPLYQLEIGRPGSSFALEIAKKIGLPNDVIDTAQNLVGHTHVKFEVLLNQLEEEKQKFKDQNDALILKNSKLETALQDYQDLRQMITEEKKTLISEAKRDASRIIKDANKKIEATIREIKESKADKASTKRAREELKEHKDKLDSVQKKSNFTPKVEVIKGDIFVGDTVKIKGGSSIAEVLELSGKDAFIAVGTIKTRIKISNLEKIKLNHQEAQQVKKLNSSSSKSNKNSVDLNKKMANFTTTLDIRGKRAEEALGIVDSFVDDGIMLGFNQLRILHGKGFGVLRDVIRNHLRDNSHIQSTADEHIEHGGSGITVVTMKE